MIIEERQKDLVIVGEDTSRKAKISDKKLKKLQHLLTSGLYKDPITAVIAEWTNNGVDSIVQAGKNPTDNPVIVKLGKKDSGQYFFSVEDSGTGLDDRDFEEICMNYLESTKENDADAIGHFGIGMKSFLSLGRPATFTCIKNGMERKYIVYEGEEFVKYDLILERETDKENGVLAELTVNSYQESVTFSHKAQSKLAYYDTVVLIINDSVVVSEIYRNDLFQKSTLGSTDTMHLCLKDVYYTIDWEVLEISPIKLPIAIRLGLSDGVIPTPSRESYITNDKSKALIISKIKEIALWFVNKYNENLKEFNTLLEAWDTIGISEFFVTLTPWKVSINCLFPFTSIKPKLASIKGITLRDPTFYKSICHYILSEYDEVGMIPSYGRAKLKTKRLYVDKFEHIKKGNFTVLVSSALRGNVKDYLVSRYARGTLFVKKSCNRKLGLTENWSQPKSDDIPHYRAVLGLKVHKKAEWRDRINEFELIVSSIVSKLIDETKVEDDLSYKAWLLKKRKDQEEERKKKKDAGVITGLGKKTGDVTMAYAYTRYNVRVFYGKKVYKIEDLPKNQFVTVVMDKEESEKAKSIVLNNLCPSIRFALVGKLEAKKIPKHYQFINYKTFMSSGCKPFMRMASAIKFDKLLNELKVLKNHRSGMLKKFLTDIVNDEKILEEYVKLNYRNIDKDSSTDIVNAADALNLYDKQYWDSYLRIKEAIKQYDFINLLIIPSYYADEDQKRIDRLVTQMLLFRKKYYNDLPEGTKIVLPEVVTPKTEKDELVQNDVAEF